MLMEPTKTVDVDRAVVHPNTLQQVGDTGRPLEAEVGLVIQIEYVAHFVRSFLSSNLRSGRELLCAPVRFLWLQFVWVFRLFSETELTAALCRCRACKR